MIALCNIVKRYGLATVLDSVSLTVPEAESLVLIGPSGCGKSTILKLIAGLITPDAGQITFDGVEITANNILQLRLRMGYVIQEGGLFPHMSAADNVTVMARYLKHDSGLIESRLHELRELVRLPEKLLASYPAQLSGGQRQRVSLMRALMLDPELLLLDEPLGALDPMIRFELQQELKTIFDKLDKTVIMVTHDLSEAAFFAQSICLMNDGKVVQQADFNTLVTSPADSFVEQFIHAQRDPMIRLVGMLELGS